MLRTGIHKYKQLEKNRLTDFFGKNKNISIALYDQLNSIQDSSIRDDFSEVILNRFNTDRNVIKRTYNNRYNSFDKFSIEKIIEQKFRNPSILDVAISDGRASCYFLKEAESRIKSFKYTGTDINVYYYLHKKKEESKQYIICDEGKRIIEITVPPFVWNFARSEGKFYFLNNLIKRFLKNRMEYEFMNGKFTHCEKVELSHPEYYRLLRSNDSVTVQNYNLLSKTPGTYSVIRAMNILHYGYFSNLQINNILKNLHNGLNPNGLLIEGSNEEPGSLVEGAIYMKKGNGFAIIFEPEKESRIKNSVLSFQNN